MAWDDPKMWCFSCDTVREGKEGKNCHKCGSKLVYVFLKPSLNKERIAYLGILVFLALLNIPPLSGPIVGTGSTINTVRVIVFFYAVLAVSSYWSLFFVGGYFGMTSGRALFTSYIPSVGAKRGFSLTRLGNEAVKSLSIIAMGLVVFIILKIITGDW